MNVTLSISPHGQLLLIEIPQDSSTPDSMSQEAVQRLRSAFEGGTAAGLAHLATVEGTKTWPPPLNFARDFAHRYLTRLCQTPGFNEAAAPPPLPPPANEELAFLSMQAPPMQGLEYLTTDILAAWWTALDAHARKQIERTNGGAPAWLRSLNPLWRLVGRVTFHLAENKRDETHPFAFMATYSTRLSAQGRIQHLPLSRALQEYAGTNDRAALLSLLTPINQAAQQCVWVKDLVETRRMYQPLAWTPQEAHSFLQDIPALEESGLIVRVPDWWKAKSPPRPQVNVKVGETSQSRLGMDALLDFRVSVALNGESLSEAELREILASTGGLVRLRGQWIEVDREKLAQALAHWREVERNARDGGISYFEGMRLLSGAQIVEGDVAAASPETARQWTHIQPGQWLERTLAELRSPAGADTAPPGLHATLRPYQHTGVAWLQFMTRLRLGACLADDMGLGKTIQVLGLLLHLRERTTPDASVKQPSLLVVPASLIANWKSEIERFAPSLSIVIAHPSEMESNLDDPAALTNALQGRDLAITTYGMLTRVETLRQRAWQLVILDEAQAIKNAGTRQSRAVRDLQCTGRIALTGTPIENRLSDLWSLFDFLNPGLLGGAKTFAAFIKRLRQGDHPDYAPLRSLIQPYILRRLKTDRRIISDLPEKIENNTYCGLSKRQAALYEQSVQELTLQLETADGIQRRGIVLAFLMRLKQICNHPSHWLGDGMYEPQESGKFQRLGELCEELAQRQEKPLIFTQFREITEPLAAYLQGIFTAPGLVLHGSIPLKQRRSMVESFQREDGPPFFILSLKAGGTGLNLTAASHVIHFDRWWNPAVENQATDRAFRIGQKCNVMVHKFVCRGTVEEKIDQLIANKVALSKSLLDAGAEKLLTEMDNEQLLRFVSLDISKAVAS